MAEYSLDAPLDLDAAEYRKHLYYLNRSAG
jgi:hypothetical protein